MAQTQERSDPAATPPDFAQRNAPHGDGNFGMQGLYGMVGNAAQSVKNRARDVAEQQKSAGAARMDAVGRAVHGAADELGKEMPEAGSYIHSAADTLQGASARLRERSVDDLLARLDRFARKQSTAAFAGSVLAGLALSRFLKSSSH
jgi:hypothetical protein